MKDHCELGKNKKASVGDFLKSYLSWSLTEHGDGVSKSLRCVNTPSAKDRYRCVFKYGENAVEGEHPGWGLDLEFDYKNKSGIVWSSIQCVGSP